VPDKPTLSGKSGACLKYGQRMIRKGHVLLDQFGEFVYGLTGY